MDRGIWATWYDLPEEGKDEYIDWLHGVYLPGMLRRPGYLWAAHMDNVKTEEREQEINARLTHTTDPSVPRGNEYLLLFGAVSPAVFLNPSPAQLEEKWTVEERDMFRRRSGVRSCIFLEQNRVDGPEAKKRAPGLTPGPMIQMGSFNINALENEEEMGAWYTQMRYPRLKTVEGCVGMRKLVSVSGWAKHAVIYEFLSMEDIQDYLSKELGAEEWSRRMVGNLVHAPGSPSQGRRIWPPA